MPTYEYRCADGHEFEFEQRITEEPLKKCVHCEAPVKRLISLPGVVFKGSGFHVTDYASKGRTPGASEKSSAKSDSVSKTDSSPTIDSSAKKDSPKPSKDPKSS